MKIILLIISVLVSFKGVSQNNISGKITQKESQEPCIGASIYIRELKKGTITDTAGVYVLRNLPTGSYTLQISSISMKTIRQTIVVSEDISQNIQMETDALAMDEVVVTGTMKEMSKLDSPVPVDILTPKFLFKNPTPSLFDALQNVNGVRPQLNCNICNTGDIHINGLEGPYTMVLIDGMPIVSSLSTVYGLSGIPNSLIERVEVVKGPASTLYGSEAIGGLINIITKNPLKAATVSADVFGTSWGELNADLGIRFKTGFGSSLLGINVFNFGSVIDKNQDGFTDMTLQSRVSVFNKWNFQRIGGREASIAARVFYEDRWGGETRWTSANRGDGEVYGESIYTKRIEVLGAYQLPFKDKVMLQYSYNNHDQNSFYGTTSYQAQQQIAFAQLTWDKTIKKHSILIGTPFRYTFYDDNTPATLAEDGKTNTPDRIFLPGIFVQDEWSLPNRQKLLLGMRYDYNSVHGNIFTPRLAYKWASKSSLDVIRLNIGRGYRVVNLFTEDHAALTGARQVVVTEALKPEQSWNANLNYVHKIILNNGFIGIDGSAFYTYFSNQILPDYDTDPNKIFYGNLEGYAVSKGFSLNLDFAFTSGLKILAGATIMDVSKVEDGISTRQLLTERITGTWTVSYEIPKIGLNIDYTGNLSGPMQLPLLGDLDPRPEFSPTWSVQNIQLSKKFKNGLEIYGGVKNLLDFNPANGLPFLIAGANDPFDKKVAFDAQGQVLATPSNPYAVTFDPTYVYASQQGRRGFLGLRYALQ